MSAATAPPMRWLADREPPPPPPLADLLRRELEATGGGVRGSSPADACLAAAESLLRRVLRAGCLARASALGLLAVDALVTYAFEAASEDPERLGEAADLAMRRISRVADESRA